MNKALSLLLAALSLSATTATSQAYTNPGIPFTKTDLDTIKANLNVQPWKDGYAALQGDGHSSLSYTMQGPFATVTRNPNLNLTQWESDMTAIYNLSRMWYFTGNTAYAQKAHDILLAWANTQTSFGGGEAGLDLGDYAFRFAGGASILRGTWPGWTGADTTAVQNLFANVYWPGTGCQATATIGPANKGTLAMVAGLAIATFCDDSTKFNHVIDLFRTNAASGLVNTLPSGQMGETGRDQGHAYGNLLSAAMMAEIAYKQGVDLFSELNNRLLACGEYYAYNNLISGVQYVPFGPTDAYYWTDSSDAGGGYAADSMGLNILHAAYTVRKGLSTPWIDRKVAQQSVNMDNFMTYKNADTSTASAPSSITFPSVATATSGLTDIGINTSIAYNASYSGGTWTLNGGGTEVWTHNNDSCQFLYKQVTGDCAIIAKVVSIGSNSGASAKAGVMIRDSVATTGASANRAWIGIRPDNGFEAYNNGWTEMYGGSNWETRPRSGASEESVPSMPYWVKVERRGNVINTYLSQDGTSWAVGTVGVYANLPSTAYIGLFVCSVSTSTQIQTTFQGVSLTGGDGGNNYVPAPPAAVDASSSNGKVTVRWLSSANASSYNVLRSTTNGSGYSSIASNVTTTGYTDTAVSNGTNYYYVIQAVNSAGTSGNSRQETGSPKAPLADIAFGGTATASANGSSSTQGAAETFDTDAGTKWFNGNGGTTGWIMYDFGSGNNQTIKGYSITSASDVPGRDPKTWTLQGSNDGSTFTNLDSQSGQTFTYRQQTNTYSIGSPGSYRYYRLNVTANNGDASGLQMAELALCTDAGHTVPNGTYRILNRNSNKALEVYNGSTTSGATLDQWTYNGGTNQRWTFADQGNGQYQILGVASGKAVDVNGNSTADGALIDIWPWSGANNQRWTLTPTGDGYFTLTSVNSGKVIDVSGGSTADGASVIQYHSVGSNNQQWTFTIAP